LKEISGMDGRMTAKPIDTILMT